MNLPVTKTEWDVFETSPDDVCRTVRNATEYQGWTVTQVYVGPSEREKRTKAFVVVRREVALTKHEIRERLSYLSSFEPSAPD